MLHRVVVLGHRFSDLGIEKDVLGSSVTVVDAATTTDFLEELSEAHAVLLGTSASIDSVLIANLKKCNIIVRYGIGVDNVDVDAAGRAGIPVANVPDYCIDEVSDHVMALLLAKARRLKEAIGHALRGEWGASSLASTRRLSTQTLGLVGYGRIGKAVADKALTFGMRVLVHDPYSSAAAESGMEQLDLLPLLHKSDFVSLHCPLTPSTAGIIGETTLKHFKEGAVLINTSRGGLVDENALLKAIDSGDLAGAALDVLPVEPPDPDSRVLNHPKILVTPHVAWYSVDALADLRTKAAENVRDVLLGRAPSNVVNSVDPLAIKARF